MAVQSVIHIILLPHDNYWGWVQAVRDYVVHFGPTVTSLPENAGKYRRPRQAVSIIDFPNAYPTYGDIGQWFATNFPDVMAEIIDVTSPEELRARLAERVARNERFGESVPEPEPPGGPLPPPTPTPTPGPRPGPGIDLQWPSDYDYVTQKFGVNADYYGRFGLPGHEGIDIRAPLNANIYACADGEVIRAESNAGSGAYGRHVRIRHAGGYRTIYAHLIELRVNVGQDVRKGQLIGLADSTGNSTGHHLHLTLKLEGATNAGLTNYPYDIIDPTPFLIPLVDSPEPVPEPPSAPTPFDKCLVGLHGRADGPMEEADWQAATQANIEALKLLTWARGEDVERARSLNPNMFIMVRAMFGFGENRISPAQFAETVGNDLKKHYDRGIRYVEVHNEPNLTIEGWGRSWADGSEFANFYLNSVNILKQRFPECKWGFPGLSPGPPIPGIRFDMWDFVRGAAAAINAADWLGVHCYWQGSNDNNVLQSNTGLEYQAFRDRYPGKLILITEFSNTDTTVDKATKARQYVKYYQHLRNQPSVGGAFSFVVSASRHFSSETWRGNDGRLSAIPGAVGARPAF